MREEGTIPDRDFPPLEELIPHRDPVILVDRIVRHDPDSTVVLISIASQRWLKRDDGSVAGSLAVEFMAQCVAAHEGLLAWSEGRPPPEGFLVGIRNLNLRVQEFRADALLYGHSWRVRGRPSLGALSHRCRLYLDVDPGREVPNENGPTASSPTTDSFNAPDAPVGLVAEGRLSVSVARDEAAEK